MSKTLSNKIVKLLSDNLPEEFTSALTKKISSFQTDHQGYLFFKTNVLGLTQDINVTAYPRQVVVNLLSLYLSDETGMRSLRCEDLLGEKAIDELYIMLRDYERSNRFE